MEKIKTNAEAMAIGKECLMNTYGRYPVAMVKGEGSYLYDADGKKYIDLLQGVAVNNLGHGYPKFVEAVKEQLDNLMHCANYFWIEPQVRLAKIIVDNSCFDKVFFGNSGAEANEGAIKIARKYQKDHGHPERYRVITMKQSFHGRTLATLTATGQDKVQIGFEPLPDGFDYATYNDIESVKAAVTDKTAAIMLEPIIGEGGVIVAEDQFLKDLRQLCDEKGLLLIFDEVQVGCGRTGKLFAHQWTGVEPDVMTMAKALGNGIPIGAIAAKGDAANTLQPGNHGTTFGGNPLATACGCAALSIILEEKLLDRAQEMGQYLVDRLNAMKKDHPCIKEVRGKGLIVGAVIDVEDAHVITDRCFEKGLILNCTAGNVLRFIPALTIEKEVLDKALEIMEESMKEAGL